MELLYAIMNLPYEHQWQTIFKETHIKMWVQYQHFHLSKEALPDFLKMTFMLNVKVVRSGPKLGYKFKI